MRIRVLGAHGGSTPTERQTSFLVNDRVALDAGSLTESLDLAEQARLAAVLLTHSHMDHVASLPFLVENLFGRGGAPIEVVSTTAVLDSLRRHLFNGDLWPDFTRIPDGAAPTVGLREVEPMVPFALEDLLVTAVPVNHLIPTYGYVLTAGGTSVVFSSDTGPTEAIWRAAAEAPGLAAMFVECSFPDEMADVARVSCHLTPALVSAEMRKFPAHVPVLLYHMKPPFLAAIRAQVAALGEPRLHLLSDGEALFF